MIENNNVVWNSRYIEDYATLYRRRKMKNLKSYVRTILGDGNLNQFNDFEKGVIFMEKSRLDQPLPSRKEFEVALEFAKDGVECLEEYSTKCPDVVKQVGLLSIELLRLQLEILDKYPNIENWTFCGILF